LKDWGVQDAWEGSSEGTRHYTQPVVERPGDWEKLPVLEPSAPHLDAQLACLRQIRADLGPEVPMLQTVFSPLAQAKNLSGGKRLLAHLRKHPEAVQKGLETIARSTKYFIEALLDTRVDGIFYAVQHAQAGLLTQEEYNTFGIPYDRQILEPAGNLWCNLLHLHGDEIYFEIVSEFSFQIVNWHDRETPPSLAEAQQAFAGTVCGGLGRDTLVYRDQAEIRKEAQDAIAQTRGQRLILSTGCVVPIIASHGNIIAARNGVE
jgi:uroporphyrinogen decarboxylase